MEKMPNFCFEPKLMNHFFFSVRNFLKKRIQYFQVDIINFEKNACIARRLEKSQQVQTNESLVMMHHPILDEEQISLLSNALLAITKKK